MKLQPHQMLWILNADLMSPKYVYVKDAPYVQIIFSDRTEARRI